MVERRTGIGDSEERDFCVDIYFKDDPETDLETVEEIAREVDASLKIVKRILRDKSAMICVSYGAEARSSRTAEVYGELRQHDIASRMPRLKPMKIIEVTECNYI